MCGIAGIINLTNEESFQVTALRKMTTQMASRGPDDEGYLLADLHENEFHTYYGDATPVQNEGLKKIFFSPAENIKNAGHVLSHIGFAHRRLSIVELSPFGHQPMCDEEGKFWLIFNGEIYNYKEISNDLKACGHKFIGNSDTEVLLHSFMEWGVECVHRLRGMFAFAMYDNRKNEAWLVRDHMGIKPVFYTIQNGKLIFASDIKTIIASGLYKPQVDWEGLWHTMSFPVCPQPLTAFRGVQALEPGCWLKLNLNNGFIKIEKYWDIPVGRQNFKMTESDAIELVESELKKSINYRLIADVEVGTFMSGGFDSTTISAIASELHQGIKAFTLGFEGIAEVDELLQAKETAAMHKMQHIIKTVSDRDILNNVNEMVLGFEQPFYSLSPDFILSQFVKQNNIKVILNGAGGDELFAGYPMYKFMNIWKLAKSFKFIIDLIPYGNSTSIDMVKNMSKSPTAHEYYGGYYKMMCDYEKARFFTYGDKYNSFKISNEIYNSDNKPFTDDLEILSYYDLKIYLASHLLYRIDQFTMMHSIEGRVPMADRYLVEAVFTIPSKYKMQNGNQKHILKKVAEKYIAPSCFGMKKKGFTIPVGHWINNELADLTRSSLDSIIKRGLFNKKMIEEYYAKFHKKNHKKLWQLVMLELWFQKFIDNNNFGILNDDKKQSIEIPEIKVKNQKLKVGFNLENSFQNMYKYSWKLFADHIGFDFEFSNTEPDIKVGKNQNSEIAISEKFLENIKNKKYDFNCHFDKEPLIYTNTGKPDYLSTAFYMINCLQELGTKTFDHIGRFRYDDSYQKKFNCVDKNLAGVYFEKLFDETPSLKNNFAKKIKPNKVFISHDIDRVYDAIAQDGLYALMHGRIDVLGQLMWNEFFGTPDWFNMDKMMVTNKNYGVYSTYFWLANKGKAFKNIYNADYSIKEKNIQDAIQRVQKNGFENGIHKSISDESFKEELAKLPFTTVANRNHYLKVKLPEHFRQLDEGGIKLDFSLGFAEMPGFRNNFSAPFRPFDIENDCIFKVLCLPLQIMDATLWHYLFLDKDKAKSKIFELFQSNQNNTLFSILWHNKFFTNYKFKGYLDVYKWMLREINNRGWEFVKQEDILRLYPKLDESNQKDIMKVE